MICSFIILLLASGPMVMANTSEVQQFNKGMESFATRLFTALATENPHKNIVFSPFSIQNCITMTRMGAEGQTASEIDHTLFLTSQKHEDLADNYHAVLSQYENSTILKIANKIYTTTGNGVQHEFNELLTNKFYSSVDSLNFADNRAAAQTINSWVEKKTNNMIKDLVDPSLFDASTRLVLVNAIHFKGKWVHEFSVASTSEEDFYLDDKKTTKVQMMRVEEYFKYADLPELDAKAIEMPYKDSDLSMLVILPNKRNGLAQLEQKLKNITLADINSKLYSIKVVVNMPKFKVEFKTELSDLLAKMGMPRMFTPAAEFGKILKSNEHLQVSTVIHKALIEVNEGGTEAAASTWGMVANLSLRIEDVKIFNADHGFVYAIRSNTGTVLFEGRQSFAQ